MSPNRHATKVGEELHVSAAMSLLMIGSYAYEDFTEAAPEGFNGLCRLVDQVLARAVAGGFARSDIFRTLLSKREESHRMVGLAQEAINCMGGDDEFTTFVRLAVEDNKGNSA